MRSKSLVLLALALGCGLVAAIGINQVMAKRGQQGAPTETQAIYVAMKDIPSRETLKIEDLKLEEWPKDKVPKGAITKPEQIAERSAKTKFYTGEPILETKLFSPDDPALGAAPRIPTGFQVVSIKVDDVTGISKLVLPGDNVDVQVFIRRNPNLGANKTMTATVLQNAKVFAVNEIFDGDQSSNEEGTIAAKTVSLVVLPNEAKRVMLAAELGKVRLTLRGPDDKTEAENTIVSIPDLLNFGSGKEPTEDTGGGLLSLLNTEPAPATEPQPVAPANVWTMLVLVGGEAPRQVQFQDGVRLDTAAAPPNAPGPAPADPGRRRSVDPPQNEPDPEPPFDPAADVDPEFDSID